MNLLAQKGTYNLIFRADRGHEVQIGALGQLQVHPGFYLYVGSAFGSGGLRSRIAHHLAVQRKASVGCAPHWHLDYLHPYSQPYALWFTYDDQRREHQWAQVLLNDHLASVPLLRFGASDCRCPTHLFYYAQTPSFEEFEDAVFTLYPDHAQIFCIPIGSADHRLREI
jgi:Uri superfamily endonuclease